MRKIPLLLIPFLFIIVVIGCDSIEGPQGDMGGAGIYPITVNGYITEYDDLNVDETIMASVQIGHPYSVPEVTVNGIELPFIGFDEEGDLSYVKLEMPVNPGDSVHLYISFEDFDGDIRNAWADIVLPDDFEITSYDTNTVQLPFGSDVEISWTESAGATEYNAYIYMWCTYYTDSLNARYRYMDYVKIDVSDTTLVYEGSLLFPDPAEVDSLSEGWGYIAVNPQCGSSSEPGEFNLQGDAEGYFTGSKTGEMVNFEVVWE